MVCICTTYIQHKRHRRIQWTHAPPGVTTRPHGSFCFFSTSTCRACVVLLSKMFSSFIRQDIPRGGIDSASKMSGISKHNTQSATHKIIHTRVSKKNLDRGKKTRKHQGKNKINRKIAVATKKKKIPGTQCEKNR